MALTFEYDKDKRVAKVCGVDNDACTEIVIPATVEYYKKEYKVTSIGKSAFERCESLTSVTIPDSVTAIGENAFLDCNSLTSVTIPNSVTEIGNWAFRGCTSLTNVTIPDSVTSIEGFAFTGCESLKEFKGKYAADGGRCLIKDSTLIAYAKASGTTYAIPDGVTSIGKGAFFRCYSLTGLTIPESVTKIGYSAFKFCERLKEFKGKYAADGGRCLIKDSTLIAYANASGTTYAIPDSVTEIGKHAFDGCKSLTGLTIPDGVTEIGEQAFYDCKSLTSVTIPNSVTKIGWWAFVGCDSLKEVRICNDEGCVEIGENVFGSTAVIHYVGKDWIDQAEKASAEAEKAAAEKAKAEAEKAEAEKARIEAEKAAAEKAKAAVEKAEAAAKVMKPARKFGNLAKFIIQKSTTVGDFNSVFFEAFGANVRVYQGRSRVEDSVTLGECGLSAEGTFECRASLTVGSFIERMQEEYGLKVKVYTCDFWVAVLDGLTLKSAGKVKKQAVKSDMESLLAYQRDDTEDVEDEKAKAVAAAKAMKPARKFAKLSTDKKIAGVCGGIAEWLGVNSTIVRIVALLTCGFYFWGYIILWLAMPRSSSTETSA